MFAVTALGHQGWLIATGATRVLIDPVLTPCFTRLVASAARVFPPRRFDLSGLGPLDAVLITHEHPDHLDFVSLQLLDEKVPVYLSAHSSDAARRVIESLGHEVVRLRPGIGCAIGDLDVLALPPVVIGEPGEDEVDVVPLLVRDRGGHGNFFTSADIVQVREMADEVKRHIDRPGVWTYANNEFALGLSLEWLPSTKDPVGAAAQMLAKKYASLFEGWGHPEIFLVNGDGVTLGGDLEALNPHAFPVAGDALVAQLQALLPGHRFQAMAPGMTAELVDGTFSQLRAELPFLSVDASAERPARGGAPGGEKVAQAFGPASGKRSLDAGEHRALVQALSEFGRFLFARDSYRGVFRVMAERDHDPSLRQTLALELRGGLEGKTEVWAFDPTRSSFTRVECPSPRTTYVAGGEFWAADVLSALTFEAGAEDLFHFGRKRLWNAAPHVFRCDLDTELELFAHALRVPEAVEALYRRSVQQGVQPVVPARPESARVDRSRPLPRRAPVLRPVPAMDHGHAGTASSQPSSSNLAEDSLARLREVISSATRGGWRLESAQQRQDVLQLVLVLSDRATLTLSVAPLNATRRFYRRVADQTFAYSPSAFSGEVIAVLDRVIDALVPVIDAERK